MPHRSDFNQPVSGLVTPRFGGIATFFRLPHVAAAEATRNVLGEIFGSSVARSVARSVAVNVAGTLTRSLLGVLGVGGRRRR